jgi:nucleoside-diphosphate-sugar epimerase
MIHHVLVTGAGGFAGAELVTYLVAQGQKVTAVIGSTPGRLPEHIDCPGNLRVVQADLSKPIDLPTSVDAIFHAAARSPGEGVSVDDMVRDNVLATRNLIAYSKDAGAELFVFFSSLSVHGEVKTEVLNEETPICNPNPYGLTKLLCEEMLKADSSSKRSLAIRLPGVIGPGSTRNWLSRSLIAAYVGKDIKVFNADSPFNNAVHITDLCHFIGGLLDKDWDGFDVVSLGAAGQLTVGAVAKLLAEGAAHGSQVIIEDSQRTSYRISSAHAQARYGYMPMDIGVMLSKFIRENLNFTKDLSQNNLSICCGSSGSFVERMPPAQ